MTDIVPTILRLDGFTKGLVAISDGKYTEGRLTIDFPTSFDRDNLEMIGITMGAGMPRYRSGLILADESSGWSYSGVLIECGNSFEK
jgi:hypothetical protein